jgi:caffeoyl-CoA O-methyltransferase
LSFEKFTGMTSELHGYAVGHSSFRDGVVPEIEAAAEQMGDLAQMQIAGDQAAFTTILVKAIGARRALEVGTFLGYGAISIARGLPGDGQLLVCELSDDYAERARSHLAEAGLEDRVEIRVGPAIETLGSLPGDPPFDLAFVDADKASYAAYYEQCLRLLRPGGLLLLDNVFMGGRILDRQTDDQGTLVMRELNDRIAADERVESAMLSIADGVTVVRKR